jgi:hypothetical protein
MDQVLAEGIVPKRAELAREHSLSLDELDLILKDLEAGIVVAVQNQAHEGLEYFQEEKLSEPAPALGEIFYARPFASFKNHYLVAVAGEQKWYGECAVEVCGISAMFPGKEVVVRSVCRQSKEPVELVGKDGVLLDYTPKTLRVHLGIPLRFMADDAVGWCDYNSFFSSEAAVQEWRKAHPEIKGITRDPVTTSNFVSLVGKGRLDYNYQFRLPILRVLFTGKKYGFTKPMPGLGWHVPDRFWMPTWHTLMEARRKGYKNLIGW